jgi:hypothetical protein
MHLWSVDEAQRLFLLRYLFGTTPEDCIIAQLHFHQDIYPIRVEDL